VVPESYLSTPGARVDFACVYYSTEATFPNYLELVLSVAALDVGKYCFDGIAMIGLLRRPDCRFAGGCNEMEVGAVVLA
jgi:hypothetical protein